MATQLVSQGINITDSNKCTVFKTEVELAQGTTWGKDFNDVHANIRKCYAHGHIHGADDYTKICEDYIAAHNR